MTIYLIAASILRVAGIWIAPLWYDENYTLIVSRLPFSQMWAANAGDVHPPLWMMIEWLWCRMDLPAWTIRIPALVFSILAVWIFYLIIQKLDLSPRVKQVAMWLMVINPFLLYYSQEARSYGLFIFLILLSFLQLMDRRWIVVLLTWTLIMYTHNYGIFYVFALAIAGWAMHKKDFWILFFLGVETAIFYLPWVPIELQQMSNIHGSYWITGLSAGGVLYGLFRAVIGNVTPELLIAGSLMTVFGWLAYAIIHGIRTRTDQTFPVLVMAIVPMLLAVITSLIIQPLFIPRPLIGMTPFLMIVLAWPADKILSSRQTALFASIFILPIFGAAIFGFYRYTPESKDQNMTAVLHQLEAAYQPGDVVYHIGDGSWINWTPYTQYMTHYKFPDCGPVLGGLTDQTRDAIGQVLMPFDQIHAERIWIVYLESPLNPPCEHDQFADVLDGPADIIIEQNEYILSGIWLTINQ